MITFAQRSFKIAPFTSRQVNISSVPRWIWFEDVGECGYRTMKINNCCNCLFIVSNLIFRRTIKGEWFKGIDHVIPKGVLIKIPVAPWVEGDLQSVWFSTVDWAFDNMMIRVCPKQCSQSPGSLLVEKSQGPMYDQSCVKPASVIDVRKRANSGLRWLSRCKLKSPRVKSLPGKSVTSSRKSSNCDRKSAVFNQIFDDGGGW